MVTSLGTSVFGLSFDFRTRHKDFIWLELGICWGISLQSLFWLILILCIDFQPFISPGTIEKVCVGGGGEWWWWGWVVKLKFSVLLWSKPLTLIFGFGLGPSRTIPCIPEPVAPWPLPM